MRTEATIEEMEGEPPPEGSRRHGILNALRVKRAELQGKFRQLRGQDP